MLFIVKMVQKENDQESVRVANYKKDENWKRRVDFTD